MPKKATKNKILIVIESPGKQKAIESYLKDEPEQYVIRASFGHVLELSDVKYNKLGVDVSDPSYRIAKVLIPRQKANLAAIIDAASDAKLIYLATDPDREGEAISQDLFECIESVGVPIYRITFTEITKKAILSAIKNKHEIDQDLVSAQRARMAIDKIVGYLASPWLWSVFKSSNSESGKKQTHSAGRVQSPAVRLIIDREEEIEKFIPEEYFNIFANLSKKSDDNKFQAKYIKKITNKTDADKIKSELEDDSYKVISVENKDKFKNPLPPLITSSLQQAAGAKFGYSADTTSKISQILYERGLVSYIRTDSVRSSPESIAEVRDYLKNNNYKVPNNPNIYANKANVQDGHEGIHPVNLEKHPDNTFFEDEGQKKIYRLIWERFVASQMEPAIFSTVSVLIKSSSGHELKANGKTLKYAGWLAVTSDQTSDDEGDVVLPILNPGDNLVLVPPNVKTEQKFTQPLPRYSEGNLIKELEKKGIGRPSTFSKIVTTIRDRDYVELKNKTYHGTEIGKKVTEKLKKHFKFLDYDYTLLLEEQLDLVAAGKLSYEKCVDDFYKLFDKELRIAYQEKNEEGETDIVCSLCNKYTYTIMHGRYGYYLCCRGKNIIDCKNTISCELVDGKPIIKKTNEAVPGIECPKCNGHMRKNSGPFGDYYKCLDYNKCTGTRKMPYGKKCPNCRNDLFWTIYKDQKVLFCMGYPSCTYREDLKNDTIPNPNNYSKIDDMPKKTKRILKAAKKK